MIITEEPALKVPSKITLPATVRELPPRERVSVLLIVRLVKLTGPTNAG
jgi:hypothetical protein